MSWEIYNKNSRVFRYITFKIWYNIININLKGIKVLDVGCGNGKDCKYISQKGLDINGIDLSARMLEIAKTRVPSGEFELMDITNITYPDNSYDGIISNCSLFHIPVEELPKTLESFKRKIIVNFTRGKRRGHGRGTI